MKHIRDGPKKLASAGSLNNIICNTKLVLTIIYHSIISTVIWYVLCSTTFVHF